LGGVIKLLRLIDTHLAGDTIGTMPDEKMRRGASRYDAIIATLVGFCALCVSGYTAYMQRQQVRAAVWPILGGNPGSYLNIQHSHEPKLDVIG
jgi:hypothetical protein